MIDPISHNLELRSEKLGISRNICTLRCLRKLSQQDMATALNISVTTYRYIESAKKNALTLEVILDLARFFKVSPAVFFDGVQLCQKRAI